MLHLGLVLLGIVISIVAGGIGFWISGNTYPGFLWGLFAICPTCGLIAAVLWDFIAYKLHKIDKSNPATRATKCVSHIGFAVIVLLTQFVIYVLWQIRGLPWDQ